MMAAHTGIVDFEGFQDDGPVRDSRVVWRGGNFEELERFIAEHDGEYTEQDLVAAGLARKLELMRIRSGPFDATEIVDVGSGVRLDSFDGYFRASLTGSGEWSRNTPLASRPIADDRPGIELHSVWGGPGGRGVMTSLHVPRSLPDDLSAHVSIAPKAKIFRLNIEGASKVAPNIRAAWTMVDNIAGHQQGATLEIAETELTRGGFANRLWGIEYAFNMQGEAEEIRIRNDSRLLNWLGLSGLHLELLPLEGATGSYPGTHDSNNINDVHSAMARAFGLTSEPLALPELASELYLNMGKKGFDPLVPIQGIAPDAKK